MNPLDLGMSSLTGGGGLSTSSSSSATSGDATASSGTGAKNIGVASNPNAAGRALESVLTSPIFLLAVALVVWLILKNK